MNKRVCNQSYFILSVDRQQKTVFLSVSSDWLEDRKGGIVIVICRQVEKDIIDSVQVVVIIIGAVCLIVKETRYCIALYGVDE